MRITKTSIEAKAEKEEYLAAHDGCDKCPCCTQAEILAKKMELSQYGWHSKFTTEFGEIASEDGNLFWLAEDGTIKERVTGNGFVQKLAPYMIVMGRKQYKVDRYRCWICGSEWESDPYGGTSI